MTNANTSPVSPSAWRLLAVWLMIGAQSFGGGAATLALIRQSFVVKRSWLTEAEFTEQWALSQITPGINLLAFTIMTGRRFAGGWGIAAALMGLLLPSVLATTLLTAGYARYAHLPSVEAAVRGVIPAVVGISLVTAINMARPPLRAARSEGAASLTMAGLVLLGSAASLTLHAPVVAILLIGGGASAIWNGRRTQRERVS